MGTYENIYLFTAGLDPDDAARRIAAAVNAEARHHPGGISVLHRPMANTSGGVVKAQIEKSIFLEDAPRQDHPSVIDLYDINCDVWTVEPPKELLHGRELEFQQREAAVIFNEITEKLAWPAVLLHDNDLLTSAFAPAVGRTDFPLGTTPDEEHQRLWAPYANPAAIAHTEKQGPE